MQLYPARQVRPEDLIVPWNPIFQLSTYLSPFPLLGRLFSLEPGLKIRRSGTGAGYQTGCPPGVSLLSVPTPLQWRGAGLLVFSLAYTCLVGRLSISIGAMRVPSKH